MVGTSCAVCVFENGERNFGRGMVLGGSLYDGKGSGGSRVLHSMNSSLREVERERLWGPLPGIELRRIESPTELNLRATISSRTDLKSSRKIVSDAHLNTSANRQYGLIPLLAVTFAALTAMSVSRKTMDKIMHANMTPNLLFMPTRVQRLKV
jgi:hypothetical protein